MFDSTGIRINKYYNYMLDSQYSFSGHRHQSFEINIVLKGTLKVVYENVVVILHENDIFIGEPNAFHRNKCENVDVRLIVFQFNTGDIPLKGKPSMFRLSKDNLNLLKIIMDEIKSAGIKTDYDNDFRGFPDTVQKLFEVFLYRILRDNKSLSISDSKNSATYNSAVDYMRENIGKSLTCPQIAKHCSVCCTTLKSAFKECAGMGVNRFFTEMKIQKAMQYLRGNKSVAFVSELLGFSSQAYFSLVFKNVTGKTPIAFRRQAEKAASDAQRLELHNVNTL